MSSRGVEIRIDDSKFREMAGKLERQVPFAMKKGIDSTLLDIQRVQRAHQRGVFEVRRPQFVDRSVKITKWAAKNDLRGTIGIEPPGGQDRADILTRFEGGAEKRPRGAGGSLAVPDRARRGKRSVVPDALRPKNLELRRHGNSGRVLIGNQRTVLIRSASGDSRGGIFQRRGRGKRSQLVRLYGLARKARTPRVLDFEKNARRVAAQVLRGNIERALDHAIRTAR